MSNLLTKLVSLGGNARIKRKQSLSYECEKTCLANSLAEPAFAIPC